MLSNMLKKRYPWCCAAPPFGCLPQHDTQRSGARTSIDTLTSSLGIFNSCLARGLWPSAALRMLARGEAGVQFGWAEAEQDIAAGRAMIAELEAFHSD